MRRRENTTTASSPPISTTAPAIVAATFPALGNPYRLPLRVSEGNGGFGAQWWCPLGMPRVHVEQAEHPRPGAREEHARPRDRVTDAVEGVAQDGAEGVQGPEHPADLEDQAQESPRGDDGEHSPGNGQQPRPRRHALGGERPGR